MKIQFKRVISIVLTLLMLMTIAANGIVVSKAEEVTEATPTVYLTNVALGKSVTMTYGSELNSSDGNYSVSAVNSGLSVLTDGENDNENWSVNNGNPYVSFKNSVITGPYSFTIDLGSSYAARAVSLYSYGRYDWTNVQPIDEVTYSVSTDGSKWTEVGTVSRSEAVINEVYNSSYSVNVPIYKFALNISASARYVKASFATNSVGQISLGEFEVYCNKASSNIASGKTVSFEYGKEVDSSNANWNVAGIEAGLGVLTDGTTLNPNWWVNNDNPLVGLNNSYVTGPYAFKVDLYTLCAISQISANFYSRTDWDVDAPASVTFYVSPDGEGWTEAGTVTADDATKTQVTDSRNPNAQVPTIYTFALDCSYYDMKFVKVAFENNSYGIVCCEEVQAMGISRGSFSNFSNGLLANTSNYTYEILGGGSGYDYYYNQQGTNITIKNKEESMVSRLTNGILQNTSDYASASLGSDWKNTSSARGQYLECYRNDFRVITIDLGSQKTVTAMKMHFGNDPSGGGIYWPTYVKYYASEDGENFYLMDKVTTYDVSADPNDNSSYALNHYWYTAFMNTNARYVKFIFPVNVYLLTDELQVWGYNGESVGARELNEENYEKYDYYELYQGEFAHDEQTGGVRNEFMAYSGFYLQTDSFNSSYLPGDISVYNTYKRVGDYKCAIAYVDKSDVAQDWLYDNVTVMGHYYTSGGKFNSYKSWAQEGKYYANQDDWYEWLCYAFGTKVDGSRLDSVVTDGSDMVDGQVTLNLLALEETARICKEELNDPDYKVGVKLNIYPCVEFQEDWGYIDGEHIDFTVDGCGSEEKALENRKKATQWYVDTAIAMWEAAGFEHLELTGFYYYEETIHETTDTIAADATRALTDIIHSTPTPSTNTRKMTDSRQGGRLYIYQLPYYQAEGYWDWSKYGFDYALMQPNYSFYNMYKTSTQLAECAKLCEFYGLGMQMEFGGAASLEYINLFEDYLDEAESCGYIDATVSWYMSTWGIQNLSNGSGATDTTFLYDKIYDFVKTARENQYQRRLGDVNIDWDLTISDVTDIQKHLAHIAYMTSEEDDFADVNGDGVVNIRDATTIQMKLAKLID